MQHLTCGDDCCSQVLEGEFARESLLEASPWWCHPKLGDEEGECPPLHVDLTEADVVRLDIDDRGDLHENKYVNVRNLYTMPKLIFLAATVLATLWCTVYAIEVLTPVEAHGHSERAGYERTNNAEIAPDVDATVAKGRLTPKPKIEPSHGEAALRLEMKRIDSGGDLGTSCTEPSPRSSVDSGSLSPRHFHPSATEDLFFGELQADARPMGKGDEVALHVASMSPTLQGSFRAVAGTESPSQRASRHHASLHSIDFLLDDSSIAGGRWARW